MLKRLIYLHISLCKSAERGGYKYSTQWLQIANIIENRIWKTTEFNTFVICTLETKAFAVLLYALVGPLSCVRVGVHL